MPQFFIERPIFAWVISILIVAIGAFAVSKMPVTQYPNVAPPSITITTAYPGASPAEVADAVTSLIENELNGAKGLLYYSSTSDANGGSTTTVTFAPGTNIDLAQVDIQNRVSNITAQLPAAVSSLGVKFAQSGTGFLLIGTLTSTDGTISETQLADYVVRNIQNNLDRVAGVASVQLFAAPSAMRIWIDPEKLVGLNLTPADVSNALRQQNLLITAGTIGAPPNPGNERTATMALVNGQLRTIEDFANVIIRANKDGSSVKLGDVARIEVGADNYQFSARLDDQPTAAFAVSLTSTANALQTAKGVKDQLNQLSKDFPTNVKYAIPYDTSPYISLSISQVLDSLATAMILVFIVMFVFLQNLRYTIIPAIVVPVAMLGTFAVMNVFGMSINVLTLFAMVLAIGILVDDAIVVVEAVEHLMESENLSPKQATIKAMPQISGAILGVTIVLSVVFIPLAFMSGSVGVIYQQFAVAMAISIIFSGFLALTFTPALCATILKRPDKKRAARGFFGKFNFYFNKTTDQYESSLNKWLKRTGRVMLVYILLVGIMSWLFLRMPTSFLPHEDQGYLVVNIELPTNASSTRTLEVVQQVEKYFLANPNVQTILAIQGFSFNSQGLNSAIAFVTLKDFSVRTKADQSASSIANNAMGYLMSSIPDALVMAIVPPAISGLGTSSGFDFRLQDRSSQGFAALMAAGQELVAATLKNPTLSQVYLTVIGTGPQLSLKIDRVKAAALGVDFSDVASIISTSIGSEYIGKFPNLGRMQNIWVQADANFRMNVESILKLHTRNASGELVPLSSFVTANWMDGPTQVSRFNSFTSLSISGEAAFGYSSGQAMTAMETLASKLPPGFGYEWAGASYQEKLAGSQSTILMIMAMLTVFLVLSALYESWAIPTAVMMIVPLGMLGAVGLVTMFGLNNDVYFTVGMVTVIGLSSKNAILIIEYAKESYDQGMGLIESSAHAAKQRFRPILMTSFAFILGVVPLTLATGAGAASQKAVGLGVMGGMLAATPFAIFFVPVFFIVVLKFFKVKSKQSKNALSSSANDQKAAE